MTNLLDSKWWRSSGSTLASATGKPLHDLELHLWTFGASGKVERFRHVADTHQHWLASRV